MGVTGDVAWEEGGGKWTNVAHVDKCIEPCGAGGET